MSLKSSLSKSLHEPLHEHDKGLHDHLIAEDGAEAYLRARTEELQHKLEAGKISGAEFSSEQRSILATADEIDRLRSARFSWIRSATAGWLAGIFWVLVAADFQLGTLRGIGILAWPIGIVLFGLFAVVVLWRSVRGLGSSGFKVLVEDFQEGWQSEMVMGGVGMFLVMGAAFALAWPHAPLGMFLRALAIETLLLWVVAFCGWPFAALFSLSRTHRKASMAAEAWVRSAPGAKNVEAKVQWMRLISLSTSHRHRLLSRALAVVFPLVATPMWSSVAARSNDFVLHQVEASALLFDNPAQAQAVAQTLKVRAQQALAAARQSGQPVGADWLQKMATAHALPGGAQVGWSTSEQPGVRVTLSMPGFYEGVYRPAGLWVANYRVEALRGDGQYALPQGVWFVPFYGNAGCSAVVPDVKAREDEWLHANTSGAGRYTDDPLAAPWDSKQLYTDFAAAHEGRQIDVECVGDPIALKSATPPELTRDYSGSSPGMAWMRVDDRERLMTDRMRVLQLFADWTDVKSWRANGESLGQALSAKFNKIWLTKENWSKN